MDKEIRLRMLPPGVYDKDSVDLYKEIYETYKKLVYKDAGTILTFIGVSKELSTVSDKIVKSVTIEAYKEEADKTIQSICSEIKHKHSLNYINIVHLQGDFLPSEPIVFVIIASKSRKEAFESMKEAVERYKNEPPIFKKENYSDGSSKWISSS
ncbi:MAG: molybdenum cofactor biosynthesis protein MoaE [Nitrososphaeria archaeon]